MKEMHKPDLKRLLRFATGQANAPIGGFLLLKSAGEIVKSWTPLAPVFMIEPFWAQRDNANTPEMCHVHQLVLF